MSHDLLFLHARKKFAFSRPASGCPARHERKVNRQMGSQIKIQNQLEALSQQMNSPDATLRQDSAQQRRQTKCHLHQPRDAEHRFLSWNWRASQHRSPSPRSTPSVRPAGSTGHRCPRSAVASEWVHASSLLTTSGSVLTGVRGRRGELPLSRRFGCVTTHRRATLV